MVKSAAATLGTVGLPRGERPKPAPTTLRKDNSVAISARLPTDIFVRLKAKVAAERTSIQDVVHGLIAEYVG